MVYCIASSPRCHRKACVSFAGHEDDDDDDSDGGGGDASSYKCVVYKGWCVWVFGTPSHSKPAEHSTEYGAFGMRGGAHMFFGR